MAVGRTDRGDDMFWMMAEGHFQTIIETGAEELLKQHPDRFKLLHSPRQYSHLLFFFPGTSS